MYEDILGPKKEVKTTIMKCVNCSKLFMAFLGIDPEPKNQTCPYCGCKGDHNHV